MKNIYTSLLLLLTVSTISHSQIPSLQWVRQIGSGLNDYATSMAVDAAGNVYTTGTFNGTVDFDPGIGVHNLTDIGYNTSYLSKTDAYGNFIWANIITQESNITTHVLTIDNIGNVYVTGGFTGTTDFDPSADSTILKSVGSPNVYIAKYSGEGKLLWAKNIGGNSMGGNSACNGTGIAIDGDGSVVTTGKFAYGTTDFDPGQGVYNLTAKQADYFVSKLDSSGNFVWAKQIKTISSLSEGATCKINLDAVGNIYLGGTFTTEADFDPGPDVHSVKTDPGAAIFICKLNASGNFKWVRNIGSYDPDYCNDIKVDAAGNVYATGSFRYYPDFDPDSTERILYSSGHEDIFVLKLDSNGKLHWAKKMGGAQSDAGYSLTVDRNGNVYTAGLFNGIADFDPGPDVRPMIASGSSVNITSVGASDIYISKLNNTGNYLWARQLGNSRSVSIGIDATDAVYVAGTISGVGDFDPGVGQRYLSSEGEADIFIMKLREVSVGVSEEGNAQELLSLYPFPSTGATTILFGKNINNGTLRVLNLLGQTIMERTELSGESCTIDLKNQASGMYMVELKCGGEVWRRNLIKE